MVNLFRKRLTVKVDSAEVECHPWRMEADMFANDIFVGGYGMSLIGTLQKMRISVTFTLRNKAATPVRVLDIVSTTRWWPTDTSRLVDARTGKGLPQAGFEIAQTESIVRFLLQTTFPWEDVLEIRGWAMGIRTREERPEEPARITEVPSELVLEVKTSQKSIQKSIRLKPVKRITDFPGHLFPQYKVNWRV